MVSPALLEDLRRTCQGSMQCVHDTLASDSPNLGLESLQAEQQYHNLALVFGEQNLLLHEQKKGSLASQAMTLEYYILGCVEQLNML